MGRFARAILLQKVNQLINYFTTIATIVIVVVIVRSHLGSSSHCVLPNAFPSSVHARAQRSPVGTEGL